MLIEVWNPPGKTTEEVRRYIYDRLRGAYLGNPSVEEMDLTVLRKLAEQRKATIVLGKF